MGLTIVLENESGEPIASIEDPANDLHRLLPGSENAGFRLLKAIDWYGDTVFNRLQIGEFLSEWKEMATLAKSASDIRLLEAIVGFAGRVAKEPHLYLKFYGD